MVVNIKTGDCELLNESPPITFPYELDNFQKHAANSIDEGNHVLVTAHTSAGKSTVAEYAIAKAGKLGKKVIYTSPIKTLSNQKYYDFCKTYESVGVLTGDIKQNPDADLLIMTTEILRNMLFRSNDLIDQLYCVIFDEVHYINDRDRGHVWEETLIMLPKNVQIIMLSATINNPEKLANWISLKGKDVDLIGTKFRPVPLNHHLFHNDQIVKIMGNKSDFNIDKYSEIEAYYKKIYTSKVRVKPNGLINDLVKFLKERDLFPCIFFSYSRKKCELYAEMIGSNSLVDHEESSKISSLLDKYLKGMFKNYERLVQTQQLRKLLIKGIGFHHSGLVHPLKELQEILFSRGLIKILFATETFAVGVNMPTRTVIFTELSKFDGYVKDFRNLTTAEYLQMAGRAGRRGKDTEGTVIYLPLKPAPRCDEMKRILTGNSVSINSKLKLNTKFLMKIIQTDEFKVENFISNSLLGEESKSSIEATKIQYDNLKQETEKYKIEVVDKLKFNEEISSIFRLEKEIKTARSNKQRKIMNQINNLKTRQVENELNLKKTYINKVNKLNELEIKVSNNPLFIELSTSRNFLTELGFISDTDKQLSELSKIDLSRKGIMAAEINECNEVLLTEIINNNYLDELTFEEIFGILAVFIEDKNNEDEIIISDLDITDNMKYNIREIGDLNIKLDECALSFKIQYNPYLSLSFVESAYKWAKGDDFNDIYKNLKLEMYEGNFVKNIMKIYNICNEIIYISEIIGNSTLIEKLQNLESKVLRDIVSFDSIYLLSS
tara:strand:- start:980 stop:3313 length:2334 start_codon:yes stop_codon:yes gene_type:complete